VAKNDSKATDLGEALKIPSPGTKTVPSRTGDGLVDDPAVFPPTGPDIQVNPRAAVAADAPPPLLALPGSNRGPKIEAVSVNPAAKKVSRSGPTDTTDLYEVMEEITVTVRGERIRFCKGDQINFHHHKPGTEKDFRRQGMQLESRA
jgi:hypothetical protein